MRSATSGTPRIRVVTPKQDHGSWEAAVTHASRVSNPVSRFGAQFAALADKVAMGPDDCLIYVARRVAETRQARNRAGWLGGRLVNWMVGEDPEYVRVSGAVLENALTWLGEDVPEDFPRGAELELGFDVAMQLDVDLRAKAKVEGIAK